MLAGVGEFREIRSVARALGVVLSRSPGARSPVTSFGLKRGVSATRAGRAS